MEFHSPLMGVSFRPAEVKEFITSWGETTPYDDLIYALERDPTNEYDPNAIKVIIGSSKQEPLFCGFIAKEVAEEMAPLLDSGYTLESVTLLSFLGTYKPDFEITLAIPDEDEDESEDDDEADDSASAD